MNPIDEYLEALAGELKVSGKAKERILAETEDHLRERAEREEARGVRRTVAENDAVRALGAPVDFAAGFFEVRATRVAKRLAKLSCAAAFGLFVLGQALFGVDYDPPGGTDLMWVLYGLSICAAMSLFRHRRATALASNALSGLLWISAFLVAVAFGAALQVYFSHASLLTTVAFATCALVYAIVTAALLPGAFRLARQVRSLERSRAAAGHPTARV